MVELSHSLKVFITFKLFLEDCVIESSIFVVQKLVLHQNGVEFRKE